MKPISQLSFTEIDLSKENSLEELNQFYNDIYVACFPNENERETFDNLVQFLNLKNVNTDTAYCYHIILLKNKEYIIGGSIFNYFKNSNCGMIEYLAIHPEFQSFGFGTQLYQYTLSVLKNDAYQNQTILSYVFCEVESFEYLKTIQTVQTIKSIPFWDKQSFYLLDFNYVQPALSPDKKSVDFLKLIACPLINQTTSISKDLVLLVIREYMKYCMHIDNPESNLEYKKMLKSLTSLKNIRLQSLKNNLIIS